MDRKRILGLLLFGCLVIAGLFYGASVMVMPDDIRLIPEVNRTEANDESLLAENEDPNEEDAPIDSRSFDPASEEASQAAANEEALPAGNGGDISESDIASSGNDAAGDDIAPTIPVKPDETDRKAGIESTDSGSENSDMASGSLPVNNDNPTEENVTEAIEVSGNISVPEPSADIPCLDLIYDCTKVDYMSYIPAMVTDDSRLETALDINNPNIDIDASAAILFDANSGEVLYYKDPVKPVFPASTAKLLTALVALDWCRENEEVQIGNEIKMVASDSTKARIKCGQVLTIRNLLEGMLLPSGNDAAYSIAAYVGRKSLQKDRVKEIEAVEEFVRLMNEKAEQIGVINSCFKTPDGYDAVGQYTTAYDMGLIGLEALKNDTILEISGMSTSRNVFASGEDVTWENTNSLINRYSGRYYAPCFGLKTGTSTMAGRCIIAAGKKSGRVVLCVIMDSTAQGRWEDAIKLMDYGLGK